ncbi:MAG: hypothetical protein M1820_007961 [Bogoriella megaspora]|nr:MAG: hypothetical protein M1820_007961 [Bogoriella megaspora]
MDSADTSMSGLAKRAAGHGSFNLTSMNATLRAKAPGWWGWTNIGGENGIAGKGVMWGWCEGMRITWVAATMVVVVWGCYLVTFCWRLRRYSYSRKQAGFPKTREVRKEEEMSEMKVTDAGRRNSYDVFCE